MRVAVAGGTGTVGRRIASLLAREGHEVRVLSRSAPEYPVDLTTGAGLPSAVMGCDAVIDASNGPPSSKARAVLVDGTARLLEAEARGGVGHHVCVSIVGIEHVPMAYYRVKLEQEHLVEAAQVPWTIVRCTQFHNLLDAWLSAAGARHLSPGGRALFQPVDVGEAASAVTGVALAAPRRARVSVAGPEVHELTSLARLWREMTGCRAIQIPIPLPGKIGRALRDGKLTCANPDVRGTRTFATWLQTDVAAGNQACGD